MGLFCFEFYNIFEFFFYLKTTYKNFIWIFYFIDYIFSLFLKVLFLKYFLRTLCWRSGIHPIVFILSFRKSFLCERVVTLSFDNKLYKKISFFKKKTTNFLKKNKMLFFFRKFISFTSKYFSNFCFLMKFFESV